MAPEAFDLSAWLRSLAGRLQVFLVVLCSLGGRLWRVLRGLAARKPERVGRDQLNLTDEEMSAVIERVLRHPWMGAKKGAGNLTHDQEAWLGARGYDAIKRDMAHQAGLAVARRRPECVLAPFELEKPTDVGQVASSDLFEFKIWGKQFGVCVHQDVFSQEKLSMDAVEGTADSEFVRSCFEEACAASGRGFPTLYYKTDRGSQYRSETFRKALEGRCRHVEIPPGCPFFNGEIERGQRDCRAVLYDLLTPRRRPRPGHELEAVRRACAFACDILNHQISRPSLGNVTPAEKAAGKDVVREVQERNRTFAHQQRQQRKERPFARDPWRVRLARLFNADSLSTGALLRFLRLKNRDYTAWSKPDPAQPRPRPRPSGREATGSVGA